jgi:hypothetical protein
MRQRIGTLRDVLIPMTMLAVLRVTFLLRHWT